MARTDNCQAPAWSNQVHDHLLERFEWTKRQISSVDEKLEQGRCGFPQDEALIDLKGVGLFTALMETMRTSHISKEGSS